MLAGGKEIKMGRFADAGIAHFVWLVDREDSAV
jgi:hypothetical protein